MPVADLRVLIAAGALAIAQPPDRSPLDLGKAAIDAHDPTTAIAHFENAGGRDGRAWLAVALMMESRSPSDRYVQRAFDAAAQARSVDPGRLQSRADLAAALRRDEVVIAFLVGERHAYAWAFDRDTLAGYPLPKPDELATAVERVNRYIAQDDRQGVQRVADDLVPALLGPVLERVPSLSRVIFVMDGPLRQLPVLEVLSGDAVAGIRRLPVSIAKDESLLDEIQRPPTPRDVAAIAWPQVTLILGAIAIALISLLARRRSPGRS